MALLTRFRRRPASAADDMPLTPLSTPADLEGALEESEREPVLVFKHSRICGLSDLAHREIDRLASAGDLPIYKIVVQEARALSDHIEATFGIRHESPQAILLSDRAPVFHASHRGITADAVREAARSAA